MHCRTGCRCALSLLLVSIFLLGRPVDNVLAQTFVRGDSNGDGLLNIADPLFSLNNLFCGGPVPPCLEAANVTDLVFDLTDPLTSMKYLFYCGPALDATSPTGCGTDMTPPSLSCATSTNCGSLPIKAPSNSLFLFAFIHTPPPPPSTPPMTLPSTNYVFTDVAVTLTNTSNTVSLAAWSISIKAQGCRIISATTDGTVAQGVTSAISQVSSCGLGATSAVLLPVLPCKDQGNLIPPQSGPHTILNLKVAVTVGLPFKLSFVNGESCCSPPAPVPNVVATSSAAGTSPVAGFEPVFFPATLIVPGGTQLNNTPVGKNVLVCCSPDLWLIFDEVTAAGSTSCLSGCAPGANFFANGGGIQCTRINTTAAFSQVNPTNITVCIRYNCKYAGVVSLWHFDKTQWSKLSSTTDPCAKVICGRVKSLSDFILAVPPEEVPFRRGDANGDGPVDLSDAVAILGCQFLGSACPGCADAADANDDGRLDIGDAIWLLNWSFLGASPPPSPGPFECGTDRTPDSLMGCNYPDFSHPEAACFSEEPEGG
jgi:hypothetical protein